MGVSELAASRLPLNRKERYYTGTVFPGIVCADSFKYLCRLWPLLKINAPRVIATPEATNIQFFTEYNLAESIYTPTDKERFKAENFGSRDTPDIMILVDGTPPLLVAIEAKLYSRLSAAELNDQLGRQWENVLKNLQLIWPDSQVFHVALLPRDFGIAESDLQAVSHDHKLRMLHWEHIRDTYADVTAASHFHGMLSLALARFGELRSSSKGFEGFRENKEAMLTGQQIVDRHRDNDFPYRSMGRLRGPNGIPFKQDLESGNWRSFAYEVSTQTDINRNWFPIESFLERLRAKGIEALD